MKSSIAGFLIMLSIVVAAGYGWIVNLLALINMEPFIWSAKSVIGIGGVFFPPVGVIMGWFVW